AGRKIAAALADFEPDLDDLAAGTASAGVPVPALVAQLRRVVGGAAASYVHWGATSQDIVDTALVLQLRQVLRALEARLARLNAALVRLIQGHRDTVVVARTRFQQALPTTFALKAAGWLAPLLRDQQRLRELEPRLLAVQLGGAAGNLAALGDRGIEVMEALAAELGLACPPIPWHNQRDTLVELGSWLALVSGSLGKLGQDVLLMAQNEIGEVREAAGGGSSTMPQKSNPVRSEALVTLARRNATLIAGLHQAMLHAHERDGSAWQLEWATLPDLASGTAAALAHAAELAETMIVDQERMAGTLASTRGLLLAEAVSFALSEHMARADAQALVKEAVGSAHESGRDLLKVVAGLCDAPVDWSRLRAQAETPPAAEPLVRRVLQAVADNRRKGT
ncbi:MAG TPA: 3-carboxy-cis,cis-muconate cycloisomerase, partial [Geminicoccaceae bacterium]|nr:3-carboxy-cis,cis-muconate cycloisomerase [Geminicoccaceae bacterium]